MLQKKLWMQLDIPSLKISLQNNKFHCPIAGRHSESQLFQKKIKEPGVFHETTGKEPPIFGLVIYFSNFWESWLYSRIEFIISELQFINLQNHLDNR